MVSKLLTLYYAHRKQSGGRDHKRNAKSINYKPVCQKVVSWRESSNDDKMSKMSRPWTRIAAIDKRSKSTPDRPWVVIPKTNDLKDGHIDITYGQLARAVNSLCWWLDQNVPRIGDFDTILYLGPNDIRWPLINFAAHKTLRKHLILNPNNALEADIKLIDDTQVMKILVAHGHEASAERLLKQRPKLQQLHFPELERWLETGDALMYPYDGPATEEDAYRTPAMITHTSGTTGTLCTPRRDLFSLLLGAPKQIVFTVGLDNLIHQQKIAADEDFHPEKQQMAYLTGQSFIMPLPMTWSAGITVSTTIAIAYETIPVLCHPNTPQPIPLNILYDTIRLSSAKIALLIPFHIKEFTKHPEILQSLKEKQMSMIGYAGAALEPSTIDMIKPYVDAVQPFYGNTELGLFPTFLGESPAIGFDPNTGASFEHVQDEIYELVLTRDTDLRKLQYRFHVEPETKRIPTNDLFTPHPTKRYFWLPAGRKDDLIKNNFLTKTHASQVESLLELERDIIGAYFGGQDKQDPFIILEVNSPTRELDCKEIVERLWPVVEKANNSLSHEIRLKKSNIIIAPKDKPLPRLGKGTIDRRAIAELFEQEIASVEALGDKS